MIPFNVPYVSKNERSVISSVYAKGKFSGNGYYTRFANHLLSKLHIGSAYSSNDSSSILTTSCTDALEMSSILYSIEEGDEVILPSYTFVSTALPFELRKAKLVFADSEQERPHISYDSVRKLITNKTKLIVAVNYGGTGANLFALKSLCDEKGIFLLEDNAQGLGSSLGKHPLGTFGQLSTLSFHETKNVQCGEGGALIINDLSFEDRAHILKDKGTNRKWFDAGYLPEYNWVDVGSSYLMSEILAAIVYSQLNDLNHVTLRRVDIFNAYLNSFQELKSKGILLPIVNETYQTNGHIFYLVLPSKEERNQLISFLKKKEIMAVSHYVSLHKSPYFINKYQGEELVNSDKFSNNLVRLPLFYNMTNDELNYIIETIKKYFGVA